MDSKRETKWEALAFRIFKSLRNYALLLVCSVFVLALSVNTASAEPATVQQQTLIISGVVTDSSGEALIGASVVEKGTSNGTATNINGAFTLSVSPNATIEVSYIGYLPSSFKVVSGRNAYDVTLKEDTQSLDELVVIGYGVQKKKLVTGANIQVSGEDIQKMSTTNVFTALQAQAPGVNIMQSNGQPGAGYIVNIRGISTIGEARPLYIVDGVASGHDALNHMSAADIESIDILKDAASSAIYGARAANGVVLVTTKQGKAGRVRISYDGSFGKQYMSRKPDMLNAKEYIMIQNEKAFNASGSTQWANWEGELPTGMYDRIMSGEWKGSDWVDAFYCKGAAVQSHDINLTGGSETSKFSMGYSYNKHDGILGEAAQSNYTRNTARINSDHVLLKAKDFDAIKIGQTLNYIYRQNNSIAQGNMYFNSFTGVLRATPLLPIYNDKGGYYDQNDKTREGWILDGATGNPIAGVVKGSQGLNLNKIYALNMSAYVEIQPVKNLIFRSQYGYKMNGNMYRDFNEKVYLHNGQGGRRNEEDVSQSASFGYAWTLDNTLTYILSSNNHNLTLQAGQAAEKWGYGESLNAWSLYNNFEGLGWDYAWLNNFVPTDIGNRGQGAGMGGSPWGPGALASFWGRAQYNYKETYLATVTMRADGSANFARGKRWGYFPSFSAGWVMSNESFMEGSKGAIDFLRLSASWGQNGNATIDNFTFLTQFRFSGIPLNYYFGEGAKQTPSPGAAARRLPNPEVKWETSQMLDLGLNARFLNNRLGLEYHYYVRDTKDWLIEKPISASWGFGFPMTNAGDVQNKGHELAFTWNDRINDFTYGLNLNGSYNKNKVTKIANREGIIHGSANVLSQGTTEFFRCEVGQPMGFFYGYKADGIFQNQKDVDDYVTEMIKRQLDAGVNEDKLNIPEVQPGDVRFRDVNGDGVISDKDKMNIGNGWPTYHLGFSFNAAYKGFDFIVIANGAFGFDIAKSYRSFADSEFQNYTTEVFKRWTGEGTSNQWPRLTNGNHPNYQRVSDIFLEKGDYVKIQDITIGYDFKRLFSTLPFGQARLYFKGQNLLTFTGYSGMDPEIGFGDGRTWSAGIDLGYYPSAKTYLFGVQLTF
jgi:TonB-linked SusC/RagA family outer membrane protein